MGAYESLLQTLTGEGGPVTDEDVANARARLRMRQNEGRDAQILAGQGADPDTIDRQLFPKDRPIEQTASPLDFMPAPRLGAMAVNGARGLMGGAGKVASRARGHLPPLPMKPGAGPRAPGVAMSDEAYAAARKLREEALDAEFQAAMKPQSGPSLLPDELAPMPPQGPAVENIFDPVIRREMGEMGKHFKPVPLGNPTRISGFKKGR